MQGAGTTRDLCQLRLFGYVIRTLCLILWSKTSVAQDGSRRSNTSAGTDDTGANNEKRMSFEGVREKMYCETPKSGASEVVRQVLEKHQ